MKAAVTINRRGAATLPAKVHPLAVSDYGHVPGQGGVVTQCRAADLLSDDRMAQLYPRAAGHA